MENQTREDRTRQDQIREDQSRENQNRIVALIQTVAGKPVSPSPDDSLFKSGLLDSFTLTDLVAAIEREFSIRIPDRDLTPRKFDSVTRIQTYIQSRS
jgi:acyl carrier protein